MILSEFIETTSKLENYYEKEYTNEQRIIMFDELKNLSLERYKKIISQCIRNCKFLPKVADILKSNNDINNENYEKKREYVPCKICNGNGFVKYTKKIRDDGYEFDYACRCICQNAEYYSKSIPNFQELGIKPNDKIITNFDRERKYK